MLASKQFLLRHTPPHLSSRARKARESLLKMASSDATHAEIDREEYNKHWHDVWVGEELQKGQVSLASLFYLRSCSRPSSGSKRQLL